MIVVAPHYAGALIAQDLDDHGDDMQRRFRYAVVTDRDLVLVAARPLMLKMSSLQTADRLPPLATIAA